MRILLDECVDWRLGRELGDHDVSTLTEVGWAGATNGELLQRAQAQFDVFLTTDQNLQFEQHIHSFSIAVVVLCGKSNRLADLRPLLPQLCSIMGLLKPGTVTRLGE